MPCGSVICWSAGRGRRGCEGEIEKQKARKYFYLSLPFSWLLTFCFRLTHVARVAA